MTDTPKCPPLGTGSIDFDSLHAAAKAGEDLSKAIDQARHKPDIATRSAAAKTAKPEVKAKAEKPAPAPAKP